MERTTNTDINSNCNYHSGDIVEVWYDDGTDDTPVGNDNLNYNMFMGFRIAPE